MLAGERVSDKPFKLTACEYLTIFLLFFLDMKWMKFILLFSSSIFVFSFPSVPC